MSERLYRVVFVGEVEPGKDPQVVTTQLAALGLLSTEQAGQMRPGKPVVLESGLTRDQAVHYEDALKATGARCQLIPSPGEAPAPAASAASEPVLRDTDLDWNFNELEADPLATTLELASSQVDPSSALDFSGVDLGMTCPKCGFDQEESEECQACGVIFSKLVDMGGGQDEAFSGANDVSRVQSQVHEGQMYDPSLAPAGEPASASDDGFFAPEKRGIEKGMLGGITMMVIAGTWFGVGYMAGFIFFYPPVLFLFGLFAFLKGLFTDNVAGR